jgi:uncharacterized protein YdaU (DUF1376 family)
VNYFPFNVGDYAAHTGHLEPMEDLAYRRLLDQYYLREGPLPADIEATAKLVRMRSMKADVESVLKEFFTLTEDGWRHSRCDAEVEKMQDKQAKARASGIASANARSKAQQAAVERALQSAQADVERSLPPKSTDVQLPTPTPTPTPIEEKTARKRAAPVGATCPADVSVDVWRDWTALRKAKRAPVSPTVLAEAESEAAKAGLTLEAFLRVWCARGSQGLQADWLKPAERGSVVPLRQSEPEWRTEQRERMTAFAGPAAAKRTPQPVTVEATYADAKQLGR